MSLEERQVRQGDDGDHEDSVNDDRSEYSGVYAANLMNNRFNYSGDISANVESRHFEEMSDTENEHNTEENQDEDKIIAKGDLKEKTIIDENRSKQHRKKRNQMMTSQSLLDCSQVVKKAVSLINNFSSANKSSSKSIDSMTAQNSRKVRKEGVLMRNKKDLDIAVQTLCKLEEEISEVVVEKTNSYARECNKRKWVKEKSDLIMLQGIERGEIGKSPEQKKLKEDRRKCLMYVKSRKLEGDKVLKKR